jgi:hypothetical protein
MGALTFEDEVFDIAHLQTVENNLKGSGDRNYRVGTRTGRPVRWAATPSWPLTRFSRCSAARAIPHWPYHTRGHKLGLLLKIEMLHWRADAGP